VAQPPKLGEPVTPSGALSGGAQRSSGRFASSSIRSGCRWSDSTYFAKTSCTADPIRGSAVG
jgi:hypothetical protein